MKRAIEAILMTLVVAVMASAQNPCVDGTFKTLQGVACQVATNTYVELISFSATASGGGLLLTPNMLAVSFPQDNNGRIGFGPNQPSGGGQRLGPNQSQSYSVTFRLWGGAAVRLGPYPDPAPNPTGSGQVQVNWLATDIFLNYLFGGGATWEIDQSLFPLGYLTGPEANFQYGGPYLVTVSVTAAGGGMVNGTSQLPYYVYTSFN